MTELTITANPVPIPDIQEIDKALSEDLKKRKDIREETEDSESGKNITRLLRMAGSLILLSSAVTFLVQQWDTSDHIFRYFLFLAFTGILTLSGFFCGLSIKEDKSARTFLGIALAVIPAHFAQLGALLFSSFGEPVTNYPAWLTWNAPDPTATIQTIVFAIAALSVVTLISYLTLARCKARTLTLSYLVINSLLLIPVRDPDVMAGLGLIMFGAIVYLHTRLKKESGLQTFEGRVSLGLLYLPFILLAGRTIGLYSMSFGFLSMIFGIFAFSLFALPAHHTDKSKAIRLQGLSIIPALFCWNYLFEFLYSTGIVNQQYETALYGISFSILLFLMGESALSSGKNYRLMGALTASGSVLLQLALFPGLISSSICIMITLLTGIYAYSTKEKLSFFISVTGFALGILYHLHYAAMYCSYSPWVSLAFAGIVIVISAAYLESNYNSIACRLTKIRNALRQWD